MDGRVGVSLPAFTEEVVHALIADGEPGLAAQVPALAIHPYCGCEQGNCATFDAVPPPEGGWGDGHRGVWVFVEKGMVVLDVLNEVIVSVEILDRPDVKRLLPKLS